jgi:hypothetical protein
MNIRKSIYTLSDTQLQDFKDALNAAKADGSYDDFIERHHHSMMTATLSPGEAGTSNTRNVAHRGPAFLPWHRYFCRELELVLQEKRPLVTLPYWDWAADAGNPISAALWNTNPAQRIYVGGNGTGPNGEVTTGPFTGWTALISGPGGTFTPRPGGIIRELGSNPDFGTGIGVPAFPTAAQVTDAIQNFATYDTSPWHRGSAGSFRNRLEGWLALAGENGSQLHNRVHIWVGGDMGPGTSPNDPVFFLHHCNIDRLWAAWQYAHPGAAYAPAAGGPPGHNLNDVMQFLTIAGATPAASLDYRRTLGFIYDTDPPLVDLDTPVVNFTDVPTQETTWRAAVFHVRAASTLHFEVVAGSGPNAPYSLTALGGTVTHVPQVDAQPFDEVRLWLAFTGENAPGPAPSGSVQIRCVETNETFTITLAGNTVARPTTGVMFCLDKSGSMDQLAGTGGTRMQLLHEAASRCVELMRDGSGAGVVSFDHDAHPGQPLAPFAPADPHRGNVIGAITGLTAGGATSIGDGIELARTTLDSGAAAFDGQALIVLTDGLENQPKYLSQVGGSIDSRTFAVGLGAAHQVSAEALATIASDTGGYILLTGPLTPDTDSYFLLSKYFQQVLVSATNENIVTDPSGFIAPGQTVRVPFQIAETEIDATVVMLVDVPAVRLSLQTPDGTHLSEAQLTGLGVPVQRGTNMSFCRLPLPLPVGGGAHAGTWHAVLEVDKDLLKREITRLSRLGERDRHIRLTLERLRAHGPRYAVTVSTWSNLRMAARATQTSFLPGSTLRLSAVVTEFGLPVERVRVEADVVSPDGLHIRVPLVAHAPGAFAAELVAGVAGVWRVHLRARGHSRAGRSFTREQLLSGVIVSGQRPPQPPTGDGDRDALECFLRCLIEDPGGTRWLEEHGIDGKRLIACVGKCRTVSARELDRLG